jgi:uncharacterized protein
MKVEKKVSPRKSAPRTRKTPSSEKRPAKKQLTVPPILLEGDAPATPSASGPGQRYAVGPTPPAAPATAAESGELPESYGTQQLLLTARDPHWLYTHWDFGRDQLRRFNALSADGHLILRVYKNSLAGPPISEIHVHPESRNWFAPVDQAATMYYVELGYYGTNAKWTRVAVSGAAITPPDSLSEDTSARFETIPIDVPFEALLSLVKTAVREHVPLIEALEQLRATGHTNLPAPSEIRTSEWTPAQEQALASLITMDSVRRVWIGSFEITELIRRQLVQELSSGVVSQLSLPTSPIGAISSVSSLGSPFGGMERRKGFWFNVNAELIIYGATEPDARVSIGGRPIRLRPDGSFSFRFMLPDGQYDLPAVAISADGDDARAAELHFSRETQYQGDVGAHPQDPQLKTPHPANVG